MGIYTRGKHLLRTLTRSEAFKNGFGPQREVAGHTRAQ